MKHALKEKITVSVDPELIETMDREVRAHRAGSRSAIVEEAIRLWRIEQRRQAIEQGVRPTTARRLIQIARRIGSGLV